MESHRSKREQPRYPAPTQLEDPKICRLSPSLDAHVAPTSPAPRTVFTWPLLLSGRWLSWTSSLSEPGRGSAVHCLCLVHTMHCPNARLALTHCPMSRVPLQTPRPLESLIHSPQEDPEHEGVARSKVTESAYPVGRLPTLVPTAACCVSA